MRRLAGLILSRFQYGSASTAVPFNNCTIFSFMSQFCSVTAEGYFLMLSVDLVVTITNPFSSYSVRPPPRPTSTHAHARAATCVAARLVFCCVHAHLCMWFISMRCCRCPARCAQKNTKRYHAIVLFFGLLTAILMVTLRHNGHHVYGRDNVLHVCWSGSIKDVPVDP